LIEERNELPMENIFPIQCIPILNDIADSKTKKKEKKIPEKIIKNVLNDCDSKHSSRKEKDCMENSDEEEYELKDCPICYYPIRMNKNILVNSCHEYCIDCLMKYLKHNPISILKCAMCRDTIQTLSSDLDNIKKLKSTFRFIH